MTSKKSVCDITIKKSDPREHRPRLRATPPGPSAKIPFAAQILLHKFFLLLHKFFLLVIFTTQILLTSNVKERPAIPANTAPALELLFQVLSLLSSSLLSSLESSDPQVYESYIRARLGTAAHSTFKKGWPVCM